MTLGLVVGGDDELAMRISAHVGYQVVGLETESVMPEDASLLRGLDPQELPEAIVFTLELTVARALALAAEVHAVRPDIDMALIAPTEKDIFRDAMRVGIREVAPSIDDPSFLATFRSWLDARSDQGKPNARTPHKPAAVDFTSRTITVVSPKGGVGKTSISSNLAVAFAQRSPMDVVLVDLDLQFGDLATVLDLKPSHTLEDVFDSPMRDNLMLKTYLTAHDAGFYVLCGADSPAANDKATGQQVVQLIRQLQDQFRYIIIDTAAGIDDATLAALECSDDAVIVSTMDVACLRSVRKEIELLSELAILPASRHVLLNFADKQSGLKVKDVEAVLGAPVDFVLPRTKDVTMAANRGVPLLIEAKNGAFAKGLKALAKRIFDRAREAEEKTGHRRLEVA